MNKKLFQISSVLFYQLIDLLAVAFSIMAAYKLYRLLGIGQSVFYQKIDIIPASFLAALTTVIIAQIFGAYRQESSLLNVAEIRDVIKSVTAAFAVFAIVLVFGKFDISRYVLVFSYIFSITSLITIKTIFYHVPLFRSAGAGGKFKERILIYGAGELGQTLYRELANSPKLNIIPIGFIDDDPKRRNQISYHGGVNTGDGLRVLGTREDIKTLIEKLDIDEVFLAMSNISNSELIDILDFLRREKIKFCFVPNLYKIFVHKLKINQLGQIPLLREVDDETKTAYVYIKPYLDFFLSAIGLILLSPLLLIIAVGIKMDSKGPVLFMHDRVGKDGIPFKMYKFRSMFIDVEPYSITPLHRSDPRITRFGRFLRKMSLDELPQIINILKGEMSWVGPRPEMPFIVAQYNEVHKERLKVFPGVTGLWQLSGDRKRAIHENMDYDLYYIRNMSFFLDIAILIETFLFAFRGI